MKDLGEIEDNYKTSFEEITEKYKLDLASGKNKVKLEKELRKNLLKIRVKRESDFREYLKKNKSKLFEANDSKKNVTVKNFQYKAKHFDFNETFIHKIKTKIHLGYFSSVVFFKNVKSCFFISKLKFYFFRIRYFFSSLNYDIKTFFSHIFFKIGLAFSNFFEKLKLFFLKIFGFMRDKFNFMKIKMKNLFEKIDKKLKIKNSPSEKEKTEEKIPQILNEENNADNAEKDKIPEVNSKKEDSVQN